jgi:Domain of unknown function (DUF5067)
MSIAPPGMEMPPPPPPEARNHKDAKAEAAAAKAYAKALRPWYRMKRWWAAGLVLFAIIAVAVSQTSSDDSQPTVSNNTTQAPQSEEPAAKKPASEEGPTFENGVLTTPDLKIQITRYKVIKAGQKGNEYGEKPVIAFWYTTTNLSGDRVNPTAFIRNFSAYQDNNPNAENELEMGWSSPDDRFLGSETENIKKGGTVENAAAFELDDLDTPVDLVAADMREVIGKTTYTLK